MKNTISYAKTVDYQFEQSAQSVWDYIKTTYYFDMLVVRSMMSSYYNSPKMVIDAIVIVLDKVAEPCGLDRGYCRSLWSYIERHLRYDPDANFLYERCRLIFVYSDYYCSDEDKSAGHITSLLFLIGNSTYQVYEEYGSFDGYGADGQCLQEKSYYFQSGGIKCKDLKSFYMACRKLVRHQREVRKELRRKMRLEAAANQLPQ